MKHSETLRKVVFCGEELSEENNKQLFVPRGFLHGFATLEDNTIFSYKCDNYYYPKAESGDLVLQAPDSKNTFEKDYLFGFSYSEFNTWNSPTWSIPVLSGDIVIFPAWVTHFTTPNKSDTPRLMIGANYWLKGEMNFKDELDSIVL